MEDDVEVTESGGAVLVRLRGEFDASTPLGQLAAVDRVASTSELRRVQIDGADVTFIDSSGLRTILAMVVAVRESGGTVETIKVSAQFRRLVELAGLTEVFGLQAADPSIAGDAGTG